MTHVVGNIISLRKLSLGGWGNTSSDQLHKLEKHQMVVKCRVRMEQMECERECGATLGRMTGNRLSDTI